MQRTLRRRKLYFCRARRYRCFAVGNKKNSCNKITGILKSRTFQFSFPLCCIRAAGQVCFLQFFLGT